jgi:hypothetical protein
MQCWIHKDAQGAHTALSSKVNDQQQESIVTKSVQALKAVWEDKGQRDELLLDLHGPGRHFWAETEAGLLGVNKFQGIQAGGDGSAHQQRMGAGVWCRHAHNQMWSIRVGRESEGTNSKRPELAALASVLRTVHVRSSLLYLCDNEAVLQDVAKWIGEGHKTSMALNKDADILTEIIQRLQGDEEAVFTKASGKLVLCEKTTNWYKQPGTREFKLRSDGKEGKTLFDSVNVKEPRSGHRKS